MHIELNKKYLEINNENKKRAIHEAFMSIFNEYSIDVKTAAKLMGLSEGYLRNMLCGNKPVKLKNLFMLAKNLNVDPWELGSRFVYDRYEDFSGNGYYSAPVVIVMNDEHANKKRSDKETSELIKNYGDIYYVMVLGDASDRDTVTKFDMNSGDIFNEATKVLQRRYEEQWYMFLDRSEKLGDIDPKTFNKTMTDIFYELVNEDSRLQQYVLTMIRETKNITKQSRRDE